MSDQTQQESDLILHRAADYSVRVEVLYESETLWLDQRRMAELFGVDVRSVSYHLKEVYASGELMPEATLRRIWRVQRKSARDDCRETPNVEDANAALGSTTPRENVEPAPRPGPPPVK